MDDPSMQAYGEDGPDDAEIGRQWREDSSLEKWFPITADQIAALEVENAALKREAHAWWTAARDATVAERERAASVCDAAAAELRNLLATGVADALRLAQVAEDLAAQIRDPHMESNASATP